MRDIKLSINTLYRDYMDQVNWNLPFLFDFNTLGLEIVDILNQLNAKNTIKSVYGSPVCRFNSGRPAKYKDLPEGIMQSIIKSYNDFGVSCNLTFSKFNIDQKDCTDPYCNKLLEVLNDGIGNGVNVSSDALFDHIKSKYPNLRLISSILKPCYELPDYSDIENPDYYKKLLDRGYDKVVLRPECIFNYTYEQFDYICDGEKSKIEFLVNQFCNPYCHNTTTHYDSFNYNGKGKPKYKVCINSNNVHELDTINNVLLIPYKDQVDLINHGYKEFKLQGRSEDLNYISNQLAGYVFEPTGIWLSILRVLVTNQRKYREESFDESELADNQ